MKLKIMQYALFAVLTSTLATVGVRAAEQPNIVLILADDMGYRDLSCYGSDLYRTPNIDKLATEGMRFTDAYAACPVCSPTRVSILSGKYPARLRVTDWLSGHKRIHEKLALPEWNKNGLAAEEVTIAELLKKKGYASCSFGKWHAGKARPVEQGFDASVEDWNLNKKTDDDDPKGVFTITKQSLDFIRANRDKPFFVYLPHYSVHTPIRYNEKVKAKYDKLVKPDSVQTNTGYAAMVEALDDSVGMFMEGLRDMGLDDNTLVIFYSDNGGLVGPTTNEPLRRGKGTLYEGGVRVPMIVRWPGKVEPETTNRSVITSTDFLPTFCDVAGITDRPADLDGVSFLNTITRGEELPSRSIYWHYPHYHRGNPGSVVRQGKYKLIQFLEDMNCELYDLEADLAEANDLSATMPEVRDQLLANLNGWRKTVNAQMMERNPNYDPKRVGKTAKKKKKK